MKKSQVHKFKVHLILASCAYVVTVAALMKLIGNSYLLAILALAGWVVLFGVFLKYISLYRGQK